MSASHRGRVPLVLAEPGRGLKETVNDVRSPGGNQEVQLELHECIQTPAMDAHMPSPFTRRLHFAEDFTPDKWPMFSSFNPDQEDDMFRHDNINAATFGISMNEGITSADVKQAGDDDGMTSHQLSSVNQQFDTSELETKEISFGRRVYFEALDSEDEESDHNFIQKLRAKDMEAMNQTPSVKSRDNEPNIEALSELKAKLSKSWPYIPESISENDLSLKDRQMLEDLSIDVSKLVASVEKETKATLADMSMLVRAQKEEIWELHLTASGHQLEIDQLTTTVSEESMLIQAQKKKLEKLEFELDGSRQEVSRLNAEVGFKACLVRILDNTVSDIRKENETLKHRLEKETRRRLRARPQASNRSMSGESSQQNTAVEESKMAWEVVALRAKLEARMIEDKAIAENARAERAFRKERQRLYAGFRKARREQPLEDADSFLANIEVLEWQREEEWFAFVGKLDGLDESEIAGMREHRMVKARKMWNVALSLDSVDADDV